MSLKEQKAGHKRAAKIYGKLLRNPKDYDKKVLNINKKVEKSIIKKFAKAMK